jgi:hypothetical protein
MRSIVPSTFSGSITSWRMNENCVFPSRCATLAVLPVMKIVDADDRWPARAADRQVRAEKAGGAGDEDTHESGQNRDWPQGVKQNGPHDRHGRWILNH